MIDESGMRWELGRLMNMAQSGCPRLALRSLEVDGATHRVEEPSHGAAAYAYVTAVAQFEAEYFASSAASTDKLLALGSELEEPGWLSCALSLQVLIGTRTGHLEDVTKELVAADAAMQQAERQDVRAWAACGLAMAYLSLHFYELAEVPAKLAVQLTDDVLDWPESPVIDATNLAEVYLRHALELERMDDQSTHQRISDLARLASDALAQARQACRSPLVGRRWTVSVDVLDLAAQRYGGALEPDRVAEVLARAADFGLRFEVQLAQALLVLALTDKPDPHGALLVADKAMRDIGRTPADDDMAAIVTWAGARAQAAAGLPGSQIGLDHARASARRTHRIRVMGEKSLADSLRLPEMARLHQQERHRARRDPLTQMPNRLAVDEWMAETRRMDCAVHLAMIDVDGLKQLNDSYGHLVGDAALQRVSSCLHPFSGPETLAARAGGDEFVVIRRDRAHLPAPAAALESELRRALAEPAGSPQHPATPPTALPSTSIGFASTLEGLSLDDLFAVADGRMYAHKRSRRGGRHRGPTTGEESPGPNRSSSGAAENRHRASGAERAADQL